MDNEVCFSPGALGLLTGLAGAVVTALGFLLRGWLGSLQDQIMQCRSDQVDLRAERDRALEGWEQTLGLGERAVRRERRRTS